MQWGRGEGGKLEGSECGWVSNVIVRERWVLVQGGDLGWEDG
jgi:hypothetical protein